MAGGSLCNQFSRITVQNVVCCTEWDKPLTTQTLLNNQVLFKVSFHFTVFCLQVIYLQVIYLQVFCLQVICLQIFC